MIYVTGDCHGNFKRFTKHQREKLSFPLTENDSVIICGDFGLCWSKDNEFEYHRKWLSDLPFQILWVQGNHENYHMIADYPLEEWHGGLTRHIVKDKILLLERGQVFTIEGKTFFTMGGASSHDIQGGILDRSDPNFHHLKKKALKQELPFRIVNESWWAEELPSMAELQAGRDNLAKAGYQVDYVISHCASNSIQDFLLENKLRSGLRPDILTDYFEELEQKLQYKHWFLGHYHQDLRLDDKHTVLYRNLIPISLFIE